MIKADIMNEYNGISPVSSVSPVRNNETADTAPVKTSAPFQLEDTPPHPTRQKHTPESRQVEQNPEENTDDRKASKSTPRVNSKSEKTSQTDTDNHDDTAAAGLPAVTAEPLMILNSSINISLSGIIAAESDNPTGTEVKDAADGKTAVNSKADAKKSAPPADSRQPSTRQAIIQDIPERQLKNQTAVRTGTEANDDTPASESRTQTSAASAKTPYLDQETTAKATASPRNHHNYSATNTRAAAESVKNAAAYGTERGQEQSQGKSLPLEGVRILAADKYQLESNPQPASRASLLDQLNNKVPANVTRNCRVQTHSPEQHHDSGNDSPANPGKQSFANTPDISMPKNAAQEKNSAANTKNSPNNHNEAFATLTQNIRNNSIGENSIQQSAANTPAGNAAAFERVDNIQQLIDRMQPTLQNLQSSKESGLSLKLEIDNIGKMQLFLEQKGAALKIVFEPGSDSCRQELMNQRESLSQQLRDMGYQQLSLDISSGREQQRDNGNSRQQYGNEELDNVKLAGNSRQDLLAILNMQ